MALAFRQGTTVNLSTSEVEIALDLLRIEGTELFRAAYPGFPGNFTRDSITYAMLAGDEEALKAQVEYSAQNQGKTSDPLTGEEPGKIHHELPGVLIGDKYTTYNGCDTTALFLLAIARLDESGDRDVLTRYSENIERGLTYIRSHVKDNLFYEDPAQAGADSFALNVTYWKDSAINAEHETTNYPIIYTLAHFQNAAAIRAIGRAMNRSELIELGEDMVQAGISKLWNGDHFITAHDGKGENIDPPSSDSLCSLLYIEPTDLLRVYAEQIENYMRQLETKVGYRTGIPATNSTDDYHTRYVWTHEQALLHAAATKHHLERAISVSARITDYLTTFPELINLTNGHQPAGNAPQLWAIGARQYFDDTVKTLL